MHRKVLDTSFLIHRMRTLNPASLVSGTNADSAKRCHAVDPALMLVGYTRIALPSDALT